MRRCYRKTPVVSMHVQDVALVIHELNFHSLNVDWPKINALIRLKRRTKLNVGLTWR